MSCQNDLVKQIRIEYVLYVSLLCTSRSQPRVSFSARMSQNARFSSILKISLYADTQATVKNIIFTVAQMQKVDSEKGLYLLLEGTDHLEGLFGDCRTQDHSRNFVIEQLGQKLGVATLIHSTMQHNPDLDMGHHRLSLKNTMGVDHINPKSW